MLHPLHVTWDDVAWDSGDAEYPEFLEGLAGAWVPAIGNTGNYLFDVSGRGNNGTLTNMDPATDWVSTNYGPVLDFDATNDHVGLGTVGLLKTRSQFTLMSWFLQNNAATFYRAIMSHSQSGDGPNRLLAFMTLVASGDSALHFGTAGYGYTASGVFPASEWHHGTWVYDGTKSTNADRAKIFKNGIEQALSFSGTIPATTHSQNYAHTIGAEHATAPTFNGRIAGTLLWHRPLTPGEIQQMYSLGPTGWLARRRRRTYFDVGGAPPPTVRKTWRALTLARR